MKKLFIVVNVDTFFLSHRKDIAVRAKSEGYDVTIVTHDTGSIGKISALGLKTLDLPLDKCGMNPLHEMQTFWFLFSLYRREKPDIVHHVGVKTMLWGTLAAKLAHVGGVVNAVSGLGVLFSSDGVMAKAVLRVMRYAHNRKNVLAIFQNDEDKALFLEKRIISEEQVRFIKGSGVDLNTFCYTEEPSSGKIHVLFTARMLREKGVFVLVDAANRLREKYIDRVQFLLCGGLDENPTGIKKAELEAVCDDDYIQWLGYRSDVLELLKSSHIMAFPSYYKEGLPKSLIEANAIGRPIVTTDSIGCRDAVVDDYNGFLIPVKDSVSLAEKLEMLIVNEDLRREMGLHAREYAEKYFSLEHVIEKHLDIYKSLE